MFARDTTADRSLRQAARMTLREVRHELVAIAGDFDPQRLDGRGAKAAMEHAAAIEKIAALIKARAAGRVDDTGGFRAEGAKSAAHGLALLSGSSVGAAAAALDAGRAFDDCPEVAGAAAQGELSMAQAAAIGQAKANNPKAETKRLVTKARQSTLRELQEECDRVKAAADRDADDRRRRIRAARSLRRSNHADGSSSVTMRDAPDIIARLYGAIGPARERLFAAARRGGEHLPSQVLDADALMATLLAGAGLGGRVLDGDDHDGNGGAGAARGDAGATTPRGGGERDAFDGGPASTPRRGGRSSDGPVVGPPPTPRRKRRSKARAAAATTKVLVRVDLDALLRGYPIDGEVCEIAGFGPVATRAVVDLLDTGNASSPRS